MADQSPRQLTILNNSRQIPDNEVGRMPADLSEPAAITEFPDLANMAQAASACQLCQLCKTRTHVVFADGNPKAKLMIIGEGPGQKEDETGVPFVGRAGQLLDKILASVQIDRQSQTYICNIVKCRPPQNRVPSKEEAALCKPFLLAQIAFVQPKLILLAGATAVQYTLQLKAPMSRIRGQWFEYCGAQAMPIFHPSFLLRNDSREPGSPKWLMWQDIKCVKQKLTEITSG